MFKMDKKTKKIFLISILIVVAIALLDIFALKSQLFGTYEQYTSGQFPGGWWFLFRNIVFLTITLVAFVYYVLFRDLSEAIAVGVGTHILWFTGLSDLLYFIIQGQQIPSLLTHLNGHPVIGWISLNILKSPDVTSTALWLSAILGVLTSYFAIKFLKEKF